MMALSEFLRCVKHCRRPCRPCRRQHCTPGWVECFFFLSFKIQRVFANLPTDFVDDDIWANILYLEFFFLHFFLPRPNPALQSCFVPACCMHAYLIIVCGMEEVATMLPKLRWNCIFLVLLPILHLAAPLCIEMGFYADIFWESRYSSEINVWAFFHQILLILKVHCQPWVKGMSGNS